MLKASRLLAILPEEVCNVFVESIDTAWGLDILGAIDELQRLLLAIAGTLLLSLLKSVVVLLLRVLRLNVLVVLGDSRFHFLHQRDRQVKLFFAHQHVFNFLAIVVRLADGELVPVELNVFRGGLDNPAVLNYSLPLILRVVIAVG